MATKTDLAWLAGIVDGEGSIGFHRNRSRKNSPTPVIQIGNTSSAMMTKISCILEGTEIFYRMDIRKFDNPKLKDQTIFRIARIDSVIRFLEIVKPYLVAKKEQAELVYECLIKTSNKNSGKDGYGCKAAIRIPYANKVWQLNKRGKLSENYQLMKEV